MGSKENLLKQKGKITALWQADRNNPVERGRAMMQVTERGVSGRTPVRGEKAGIQRWEKNWPQAGGQTACHIVAGGKAENLSMDAASEQMQYWKSVKFSSGFSCPQQNLRQGHQLRVRIGKKCRKPEKSCVWFSKRV